MGLFSAIRGEFIDIIEWTDSTENTIVYRFERHENEIKNGAQLTVREGQTAIFINEGQLADVFTPGRYELATENLPILSTLKGWKYGFDSPFKAEVYFVNTKQFTALKWGTKSPITLNDARFGLLEIRAFGTYAMRVTDAAKFLKEVTGTDGHFTTEQITGQLRSLIATRFTDVLGEASIPVEAMAAQTNELSELVTTQMRPEMLEYGIHLEKLVIENLSMPDEVKKEIFELSRLGKINMQELTQLKTAKAIEAAAKNPGGDAGAGMGMGMGFAMAQQMGQALNPTQQQQQTNTGQQQQQAPAGPPPIPGALSVFVAIDGKQAGPFGEGELKTMIAQGQLTRDSLIWKEGMANWQAASLVREVNALFGSVPPPIPG